jgi:hypothetical protein
MFFYGSKSNSKFVSGLHQLLNTEYGFYAENIHINRDIYKFRTTMAKEALNKKKVLFTRKMVLNLRKKQVECYIWSTALYGVESWSLRKIDQKYQQRFEMW